MSFEFDLKTIGEQPILSITTRTTAAEISKAFMEILPRVGKYAESKGQKLAGPPFSRFHEYHDDHVIVEAGIPVLTAMQGEGEILSSMLPAGEVAHTVYTGPYTELVKVYPAMLEWFTKQGKESAGAPWEVYVTDPGDEPDPQNWRTEINWPVR